MLPNSNYLIVFNVSNNPNYLLLPKCLQENLKVQHVF